jgi:hypothetical protein
MGNPINVVKPTDLNLPPSVVIDQMVELLGTVPNLHNIKAVNVFNNNWRVDVWCNQQNDERLSLTSNALIEYSYFVTTDDKGKILKSKPEIVPIS